MVNSVRCAYPGDAEYGAMYVPMTLLGLEGFVFDVVLSPFDALAVVIDRSRNGFVEEWRWLPEMSSDGIRSAVLEITHYKVGGRAPVQIRLEGVRKGSVRVSDPQGRCHTRKRRFAISNGRWHANAWPYFYSVAICFDFSSDFEGALIIGGVKVHD